VHHDRYFAVSPHCGEEVLPQRRGDLPDLAAPDWPGSISTTGVISAAVPAKHSSAL
jgi:hypothetical protein